MSLELFAEYYRRNSAEYKLVMKVHDYTTEHPKWGQDLRWLEDDDLIIEYWFDGDAETAEGFYPIAATHSSGVFAVWILAGVPRKQSPFVFLGSEGDANVVAEDVAGLLSLLALPYDDIDFSFSHLNLSLDDEPSEELTRFQAFLREQCDIEPAAEPKAVVHAAQAKHPSLQAFVEAWADAWSEKKHAD